MVLSCLQWARKLCSDVTFLSGASGDLVAAAEQRGRNGLQAAAAFECVFERGYLGERVGRVFGERFQVGAEVERIVHRGQVYVAPLFDGRQVAAGGFGVSLQAVELFHRTGYGHFVDARFRIFVIYQAARRGVEGQGEFLAVSVAVIDRAVDGAGERQYGDAVRRSLSPSLEIVIHPASQAASHRS